MPGFVSVPLARGRWRIDQMAGVLAHELGHAALATNIRSNHIICIINAWLSRVVSEESCELVVYQIILERMETAP
jgi:Zn-dependent peptidase ImmA (M78 family)